MNSVEWTSFIVTAIGNFGFPIVITAYLLLRFEKRIDHLNHSIQALSRVVRDGGSRNERKKKPSS
jgi:hypothetical protein